MRLFTKTFVFFISVIILQASLTIFIITDIIRRNDLEDAKKVLADEARAVNENYFSWKRIIWIDLIGLAREKKLMKILQSVDDPISKALFSQLINEKVFVTGIDCLVVKSKGSPFLDIIPRSYNILTLEDVKELANPIPHPYIRTEFLGSNFCMVGRVRIDTGSGGTVDFFLIKFIDEPFFDSLTVNRNARASIFMGSTFLSGTFKDEHTLPIEDMVSSHKELYGIEIKKKSYNVAVQRVGSDPPLYLATYLSNLPYQERLFLIRRSILSVLALGASLTALLSFFLSKNISMPVKKLLRAMHLVKDGKYDTEVGALPSGEIGELFQGFNEMARTLGEDRAQMDRYIREILMLKEYNEKIIHSIRAGIAIINREMVVEKANSSFLECFHMEEKNVSGARIDGLGVEVIDSEVLGTIPSILNGEKRFFSKVKRSRGGKVFEIKLYPLSGEDDRVRRGEDNFERHSGCVCTVEDVSEKVELEHKIFQAEKLAVLSILSAGVAHEINNPLSSIMSNVQNLLDEEKNGEKKTALKWIEQETRRIARIIQELMNFSSSGTGKNAGCDVKEVIDRVVNLIRYSRNNEKNISIETEIPSGLLRSVIDEDELKQVIINLVINSIQAIELSGLVRVSASRDGGEGMIRITVDDTGEGMSREVLAHIFDPFFTTKGRSGGTGLGLSVVYGIVKKYGGRIDVESRVGAGTKVSLVLPAVLPKSGS